MAEKRKLFAEVDKCFKKIDEGVELFEEIMMKVQEANSDNQREKYQDDLKKEIKKLQRLRDQVKVWQTSSDIKDKQRLNDYRRIIEHRMEQFKDIERENKTKPHSKQGLCAEEKLDPKEKEKSETIDWLQTQLRILNDESDRTEMQIESLSSQDGGKRRGKKDDTKKGEKEKKIEGLNGRLERLKLHIGKLEIIMRMVNNESLEAQKILDVLKDQMEMFTEALSPDYEGDEDDYMTMDPEDCYDELNLGHLCAQLGTVAMGSVDDERENGHDNGSTHDSEESKGSRHGSTDATVNTPSSPAPRRTVPPAIVSPTIPVTKLIKECATESPVIALSSPSVANATPPPPPPGIPYNSVAAGRVQPTATATPPQSANANSGKATFPIPSVARQPSSQVAASPVVSSVSIEEKPKPQPEVVVAPVAPSPPVVVDSYANSTRTVAEIVAGEKASAVEAQPQQPSAAAVAKEQPQQQQPAVVIAPQQKEVKTPWDNEHARESPTLPVMNGPPVADSPSISAALEPSPVDAVSTPTTTSSVSAMPPPEQLAEEALRQLRISQQNQLAPNNEPQRATIPAWLGASPLGRAPTSPEIDVHLGALEMAFSKSVLPFESEKPRTYLPKIGCHVSAHYPAAPPPNGDTLEYYLRLTPETLFFIFYYMEGTKAQLLAAKALKKLSWRFHTKYLTWFQRHEEPKQITDDYEQGTYVYFDFEKWSQRKKEAFTFEYRFLEDKEFD